MAHASAAPADRSAAPRPAAEPSWAKVPHALLVDRRVSAVAKCLFGVLRMHGWETGESYPGHQRLAAMLDVSDRHVRTLLDDLHEAGWITRRERQPGGVRGPGRMAYDTHDAPVRGRLPEVGFRNTGADDGPNSGTVAHEYRKPTSAHGKENDIENHDVEGSRGRARPDPPYGQRAFKGIGLDTVRPARRGRRPADAPARRVEPPPEVPAGDLWRAARERLYDERPSARGFLEHGVSCVGLFGRELVLEVAPAREVARSWLEGEYRSRIETALAELTGRPLRIKVRVERR